MNPIRMEEHYIGVDLGGTKILAGVFDAEHQCLATDKTKTKPEEGYDAVRARIVRAVRAAAESAGIAPSKANGVGIGAPGAISSDESLVLFAPNLGLRDAPLKADLEADDATQVALIAHYKKKADIEADHPTKVELIADYKKTDKLDTHYPKKYDMKAHNTPKQKQNTEGPRA